MFLSSCREMWLLSNMMCTAHNSCDEVGTAMLLCELDRLRVLNYTAFSPKVV